MGRTRQIGWSKVMTTTNEGPPFLSLSLSTLLYLTVMFLFQYLWLNDIIVFPSKNFFLNSYQVIRGSIDLFICISAYTWNHFYSFKARLHNYTFSTQSFNLEVITLISTEILVDSLNQCK